MKEIEIFIYGSLRVALTVMQGRQLMPTPNVKESHSHAVEQKNTSKSHGNWN